LGKNNEEHFLRDEEESGESKTLDLEEILERSFTVFKMLFKFGKEGFEHIHGTTLDDFFGV
jgi:hypothetical protein